jgi:hypothetical protein
MAEKPKKSVDELKEIIMQQVQNHPACVSVKNVEIVPAPEQPSPQPNWKVIWTLSGEPSAPPGAQEIEGDVQSRFMLA